MLLTEFKFRSCNPLDLESDALPIEPPCLLFVALVLLVLLDDDNVVNPHFQGNVHTLHSLEHVCMWLTVLCTVYPSRVPCKLNNYRQTSQADGQCLCCARVPAEYLVNKRNEIKEASPGDKSYQVPEYSPSFHKLGSTRPVTRYG